MPQKSFLCNFFSFICKFCARMTGLYEDIENLPIFTNCPRTFGGHCMHCCYSVRHMFILLHGYLTFWYAMNKIYMASVTRKETMRMLDLRGYRDFAHFYKLSKNFWRTPYALLLLCPPYVHIATRVFDLLVCYE